MRFHHIAAACTIVSCFATVTPAFAQCDLDQEQASTNTSASGDRWQSFTAGVTGDLCRVGINCQHPVASSTLEVYNGEGTGGALLHSQPVSLVAGVTTIDLTSGVPVTTGATYTLHFTTTNAWRLQTSGAYPGGRSSLGPNDDFWFRTFVDEPAIITVNSTADVIADDGQCTLREAIIAANTNTASGAMAGECAAGEAAPMVDEIIFTDPAGSPDLYTLTIAGITENLAATGDLDITEDLTMTGNGQAETIIQAGTDETNGIDRVFDVFFTNATFEGVTIQHGDASFGGGIYNVEGTVNLTNSTVSGNTAGLYGGGIYSEYYTTVNLTNSTVSGNSANYEGGGIYCIDQSTAHLTNSSVNGNTANYGGGIYSEDTTVNLTNSTVSGNTANHDGGGIFNAWYSATVNLINSTISGNTAEDKGGGIYNDDATANLTNSTVSDNSAPDGGGIYNEDVGATVNLTNTIIADQLAGGDCSGAVPVTSNDYNLDSDGSCNLTQPNDKPNNPSANLGPLQLNAPGNTATHALLPGSDAIDTGDCTGGTITTDQRGLARPQLAACDIGAYEAAIITVNSTADVIAVADGQCTLREAIIAANTNTASGIAPGECPAGQPAPTVDVIAFTDPAGSPDLYTLTIAGTGEEAAATGDLDITEELTITGNGQTETIIQAGTDDTNGIDRVFDVLDTTNVTFEAVTIRHGDASYGGGIWNSEGGTVNLTNSTVKDNTANSYGGGIYNGYGTANLTNSTVSGNSAPEGGGIYNDEGTLDLTDSIVSGNSAGDYGGGIYTWEGTANLTNSTVSGNSAPYGGAIWNEVGTVGLTNSTVSGNTANISGGGISNDDATANLTNSTVSGNTAPDGGGIYNTYAGATVNLTNTIIANQLAGGDCSGPTAVTSNDYNLDSDGSCNLTQLNDKPNNPSANLGPLQLNAPGNTATHALLPGSEAIDTGDCTGGTITTDQRGLARPQLTACDIGAYEAAPIIVNSTADVIADDGECTLREAIIAANTNTASGAAPGECAAGQPAPTVDVIAFTDPAGSPDLYTLTIAGTAEDAAATGDLDITEVLTITGNGQAETIIQAGTDETNGIDRVFEVRDSSNATFEGVTIRNGNIASYGGGIRAGGGDLTLANCTVTDNEADDGGGIWNSSGGVTMTISNSTFSGNRAGFDGGGIQNGGGGVTMTISNSTFSGNRADDGGGGIYSGGGGVTMTISNSTFSGNEAGDEGGGIWGGNVTMTLTNSTVSGNEARVGGGIYNISYVTVNLTNSTVSGNTAEDGGGIYNEYVGGTVNLTNTIVADQLAGGDCSGPGPVTSNDYNLDSDGSCNLTQPNDKPNNPSANLGPLQLNAPGNTATHALLASSDAIDTGDCTGGTITTDQRGLARPQLAACDIGAYEAAFITVNSTADVIADDGACTLREAIIAANTNTASGAMAGECAAGQAAPAVDEIIFTDPAGSPDLYTLTIAGTGEGAAATGDLDITEDLIITGNGQAETIIQAGTDETNGIDRVFEVRDTNATFEGVTIQYGNNVNDGGGIYSEGAIVTLTNSTVSGNTANTSGGGIFIGDGGTVNLTNSTVSGNTANTAGGGIYNSDSAVNLVSSTVSGNSASFYGGGIYNGYGTANLTNSTVSGNSATYLGGGIYNSEGTVNLVSSTVSGNSANDEGGGIYNILGTVNLTNSTVSGNIAAPERGGVRGETASGGGISNDLGTVNLTNSTVSGNSANYGGGIYSYDDATVNLTNTIIADQLAGGDCSGAVPVTSNDYNLDSDGSCNLTQPNDKPNNPSANLGPLQLNAPGNTATHALLPGSDAIDTGDCTGGTITTDQRGVARPQDAACDIGAYELGCLLHDMNGDGFVSIVGDVPAFVDCVYFGNCACSPEADCVCCGDCNCDGFLSIVGDVPCFVDCVFFGSCTDCSGR